MKPIWIVVIIIVVGIVVVWIIAASKQPNASKLDAEKQAIINQIKANHPNYDASDELLKKKYTVEQLKAMIPASVH